jgi:hypothetical protein
MGEDTTPGTRDQQPSARRGETWNEHWQRKMREGQQGDDDAASGDRTKPPQPDGTTPLERDQRPINQSR